MEAPEYNTVDVYPIQAKDQNQIYPFYEALKKGILTTTKCLKCGNIHWPPRTLCPGCWSTDLEWIELPRTGEIDCYATQVVGLPPGFDPPIVFAIIKLGSGVKIFSKIVDTKPEDVRDGARVELKVQEVSGGRVIPAWKVS